MSNSFTLRDGQTVAIDFAQEPNLGDFTKLIALLELQRSFIDGSPAPSVVVDVRSAPEPKRAAPECTCPNAANGRRVFHLPECPLYSLPPGSAPERPPVCRLCGKPLMSLHELTCELVSGRIVGLVSQKDCTIPSQTIVDDPPDAELPRCRKCNEPLEHDNHLLDGHHFAY